MEVGMGVWPCRASRFDPLPKACIRFIRGGMSNPRLSRVHESSTLALWAGQPGGGHPGGANREAPVRSRFCGSIPPPARYPCRSTKPPFPPVAKTTDLQSWARWFRVATGKQDGKQVRVLLVYRGRFLCLCFFLLLFASGGWNVHSHALHGVFTLP
ncbi:hypothetical protein LZ31DRAFT_348950 [Colletotrichum somersetense]|nr:hypothetical protein LZ31DRAFT_348950 [Colletotrichum somersetense]